MGHLFNLTGLSETSFLAEASALWVNEHCMVNVRNESNNSVHNFESKTRLFNKKRGRFLAGP